MVRLFCLLAALTGCCTVSSSSAARAEAFPRVVVQWTGDPCGSATLVQASLQRWLDAPGDAAEADAARIVHVHAAVDRDITGDAYVLTLNLSVAGRESREVLRVAECAAVVEFVALKTALLLDPLAVVDEAAPATPATPPPAPAPGSPPASAPIPAPTSEAPSMPRDRLGVRIASLAAFGLWPRTALGLDASALWQRRRFRAELGAHTFLSQRLGYGVPEGVGARVRLSGGSARACLVPTWTLLELPLCLGIDAGAMRAEGYGVMEPRESRQPFLALGAGAAASIRLHGPLRLWVQLAAAAQLLRITYQVQNLPRLYRAGPGALRLGAGIELQFP